MSQGRTFVGKYETYPDLTGKRVGEGGRRLTGSRPPSSSAEPLVSIITVCWNSAKTLDQTIQSVRAQTYKNIEYIIIDAASTDGTLDIIAKHDDFVDYYVSEPDDGLYYAMNKGLELASGEYILILNSDDWYEVNAVEDLVRAKDYSGCDFVSALARYVDEETGETHVLRSMPFNHSQYLRMSLRHETMLVPADLYDKLGPYDVQYRIISDLEFTRRLFKAEATHYELPSALLNFRLGGVSNVDPKKIVDETKTFIKDEFPFLSISQIWALADSWAAGANEITQIAQLHYEKPTLFKACRALLDDRAQYGGVNWQYANLYKALPNQQNAWPKVSVIIPFYRNEQHLRRTIDSVLVQSLREIEVICINDGAIDGSQQIVDQFRDIDERVRSFKNAKNLGPGASRNKGIREARGEFVFFLDADDTIPPHALSVLYSAAKQYRSDIVRGAIRVTQGVHGQSLKKEYVRSAVGAEAEIVPSTSIHDQPDMLDTTEGHTTCLYKADVIRAILYPTDLRVGEDSVFIVSALLGARSVTHVPDEVYEYRANEQSAMNKFTERMYFDALTWRNRAWYFLKNAGHASIGENLLFSYWGKDFFSNLYQNLTTDMRTQFFDQLGAVLIEAGFVRGHSVNNRRIDRLFSNAKTKRLLTKSFNKLTAEPTLRVANFVTWDLGGAGQGSQRRVKALRNHGVQAEIFCLFKSSSHPYVRQLPFSVKQIIDVEGLDFSEIWKRSVEVSDEECSTVTAKEFFSTTRTLVEFTEIFELFQRFDITHLHWVVGMFDYDNAPEVLGKKPVVWTLADMNAFTGGCHYSEGCEGFKNECRSCPLLGGGDFAHEQWKQKKKAYEGLSNLHIICLSQWLAEKAKSSSLLGDRPVHVIPNALPVETFEPLNKFIARKRLGLPFDKKLILFGAASLNNKRKGGDILQESLRNLRSEGLLDDTHGVVFGASTLELDIETHSVGHISDEKRLSWVYAAADVFAFPSREDNAPLTVAEAMLCGTPVVGFDVGNVPELVNHKTTGYIADYLDVDDFSNGLLWALENARAPHAVARSLQCHLDAKAYNDPVTSASRHIALYKDILREMASN